MYKTRRGNCKRVSAPHVDSFCILHVAGAFVAIFGGLSAKGFLGTSEATRHERLEKSDKFWPRKNGEVNPDDGRANQERLKAGDVDLVLRGGEQ